MPEFWDLVLFAMLFGGGVVLGACLAVWLIVKAVIEHL